MPSNLPLAILAAVLGYLASLPKRIYNAIFRPAARYPADPRAVFILALSVFGGVGALALEAAPETLESLLPRWGVVTWGILLTLGSLIALVGMLIQSVNGIIAEQVGSVMVGATTIFYSGLAIWIIGSDALQNVGIILAWGLACFIRWAQLQYLINQTAETVTQENLEREVHEEIERRGLS
jgi:protein-S-isoprenylcysteine O-methyltransferase Ste14